MPSVEILVEDPQSSHLDESNYTFALCISEPPESHRSPSLWQECFQRVGGRLYHLGEPRFKGQQSGWFYAYDLIDEVGCKTFRFKAKYAEQVQSLVERLLEESNIHRVYFTSDWQLSENKPRQLRPLSIREFRNLLKNGLSFNTWIPING
jgi:hypothetical protein